MPSASISTGRQALRAWACSAGRWRQASANSGELLGALSG